MTTEISNIFKPGEVSENINLESFLIALSAYGDPNLLKQSEGWYVGIKMHTASLGASFTIRSDFDHKTPLEAAIECRKRMNDALDKFGSAK